MRYFIVERGVWLLKKIIARHKCHKNNCRYENEDNRFHFFHDFNLRFQLFTHLQLPLYTIFHYFEYKIQFYLYKFAKILYKIMQMFVCSIHKHIYI